MIIHVVSPTRVELYSGLNAERKRECLFACGAEKCRSSVLTSGMTRNVF